MKRFFTVRNKTHYFEKASDKFYLENSNKDAFKKKWINEAALTMALVIPGADEIQVLDRDSVFYRAAADIFFYLFEDNRKTYIRIRPRPVYTHKSIGLICTRTQGRQDEIRIYKPSKKTIII